MVTESQLRKPTKEYPLDTVRKLAAAERLDFGGWKAYDDSVRLKYTFEDVCACLARLDESHFSHAERYPNDMRWHDVYKVKRDRNDSSGLVTDLYIKFVVTGERIAIYVYSFHD